MYVAKKDVGFLFPNVSNPFRTKKVRTPKKLRHAFHRLQGMGNWTPGKAPQHLRLHIQVSYQWIFHKKHGVDRLVFLRQIINAFIYRGSASLVTAESSRLWRRIWLIRCMDETSQDFNREGHGCAQCMQLERVACASKSVPNMHCFVYFDLKMCWSETVSFLRFWLENVLLATAAYNFSTSELEKVVRDRQFLTILTWKCASRHSGVQFFHIATSKSGTNMRAMYAAWESGILLENVLRATAACKFACLLSTATSAPAAVPRVLFDPAHLPWHFAPVDLLSTDFRAIVSSFFWLYFSALLCQS